MDRNVYKKTVPTITGVQGVEPKPPEKLLKYFPTEGFALYAALEPAAGSAFSGKALTVALWVALALSLILLVLVLKAYWKITNARQYVISSVAFIVYVAALGGPFATLSWFKPAFALIASIFGQRFHHICQSSHCSPGW